MPVWPAQEAAPYAIAVKELGSEAFLYGESVIALLGLAPTDPPKIWVGTPKRVRRNLDPHIEIVDQLKAADTVVYEDVPSQPLVKAIVIASKTMGKTRALQAAHEGARQGYLSRKQVEDIERERA